MASEAFLDLNRENDHKQLKSLILSADISAKATGREHWPSEISGLSNWLSSGQASFTCPSMPTGMLAHGRPVPDGSSSPKRYQASQSMKDRLRRPSLLRRLQPTTPRVIWGRLARWQRFIVAQSRAAAIMSRYRSLRLPIGCTSLGCLREITRYRTLIQRSRRHIWCRLIQALVTFTILGRSYGCLRLNQDGSRSAFRWVIIQRPGRLVLVLNTIDGSLCVIVLITNWID